MHTPEALSARPVSTSSNNEYVTANPCAIPINYPACQSTVRWSSPIQLRWSSLIQLRWSSEVLPIKDGRGAAQEELGGRAIGVMRLTGTPMCVR